MSARGTGKEEGETVRKTVDEEVETGGGVGGGGGGGLETAGVKRRRRSENAWQGWNESEGDGPGELEAQGVRLSEVERW